MSESCLASRLTDTKCANCFFVYRISVFKFFTISGSIDHCITPELSAITLSSCFSFYGRTMKNPFVNNNRGAQRTVVERDSLNDREFNFVNGSWSCVLDHQPDTDYIT